MKNTLIAPSVLAADFGNLQRDIEMINNSEADWFHIDIMDGVFVPNISYGMPVLEAINRQLAHYPYHIGQIVFYAKMLKKSDWESLSIPKNKSVNYNADKFEKEKSIKNFTDDELNRLKK